MAHTHEMESSYPDFGDGAKDRQRVTIRCERETIGVIQQSRRLDGSLAWMPNYGGISGDIPGAWEREFPTPYADIAIAWIEDRHMASIGIETH